MASYSRGFYYEFVLRARPTCTYVCTSYLPVFAKCTYMTYIMTNVIQVHVFELILNALYTIIAKCLLGSMIIYICKS